MHNPSISNIFVKITIDPKCCNCFSNAINTSFIMYQILRSLVPGVPKYRKDPERRKKTRKDAKRPGKAQKDAKRRKKTAKRPRNFAKRPPKM